MNESFQSGGVPAVAVNLARVDVVGAVISEDSGIIVLGQSRDQSTVSGGRVLRRERFCRCARKIGMLLAVSIAKR